MGRHLAVWVLCLLVCAGSTAGAQGTVYVVDVSPAPTRRCVTLASLQGLVNRQPQQGALYLLRGPNDARWLRLYTREPAYVSADDLLRALAGQDIGPATALARRAKGQILYDPMKPYTLAIATTMAGVMDAVITDEDLGLKTVLDCRTKWADKVQAYRWAMTQALPRCSKSHLAISGMTMPCMRDFFVRNRVFVTDLDPRNPAEQDLLQELLPNFSMGADVFAHPAVAADSAWVNLLAGSSLTPVPCSDVANLSFHGSAKPAQVPPQRMPFAERGAGVLLTFVYSGGSDMAHAFGGMRDLWELPGRGSVPVGWTIPAALYKYAPAVFEYYSVRALRSPADELVWAPNFYGSAPPSAIRGRDELWDKIASVTRPVGVLTAVVSDTGAAEYATSGLGRLISITGVQGVLLEKGTTATAGLYGSVLAVAESYRATDPYTALKDLRELYKERKPVYVSVDPTLVSPADLSWLAGRLSDMFQVVGPAQFCRLAAADMRKQASPGRRRGSFSVEDLELSTVRPGAGEYVNVSARVTSRWEIDSVSAVYSCPAGSAPVEQPMTTSGGDTYTASLPPCPFGGAGSVQVHVRDVEGHTFMSEPAAFEVDAPDGDLDRLTDAGEALLRTDPTIRDTDGDGLRDGNDPSPLDPGRAESFYLPPFSPAADAPFLAADEGSQVTDEGVREARGDASWTYRLPLGSIPKYATAVVNLVASGEMVVSASADGSEWREAVRCSSEQPTGCAWRIPDDWLERPALFLRLRPGAADKSVRLYSTSISPPADSPSILPIPPSSAHPAEGESVLVGATVYDPQGLSRVWVTYSTREKGETTMPLWEVGRTQNFGVALPGAKDGEIITYWVGAENSRGTRSTSSRIALPVGITAREIVTLAADRDFEGPWRPGSEWGGASRWAARAGQVDEATFLVDGSNYVVWLLAAPRGRAIRVELGKMSVELSARAPDGWHKLGTVYLREGENKVRITSGEAPLSRLAACGYAQVLLTADPSFEPPDAMIDFLNALTLVTPKAGENVWGQVEVLAKATGNITRIECLIDGKVVGATNRTPLRFKWDSRSVPEGRHILVLRGYSHARRQLLDLVAPIVVRRP